MEEAPKAKSRLVAGLLALAGPGYGQVFLGRTLRGLAWLLASFVGSIAAYVVRPEAHPLTALVSLCVAAFAVQLGALVDAILLPTAKHRPMSFGAMLAFAVTGIGAAIGAGAGTLSYGIGATFVGNAIMTPTLLPGDRLLLDKRVYTLRAPRRGEIVVFTYPEDRGPDIVRRIVAGPSDRFALEGGHPIINGWHVPSCKAGTLALAGDDDDTPHQGTIFVEFLERSAYLIFIDDEKADVVDDKPEAVVERDRYRVLGDRRSRTNAAFAWSRRNDGTVPAAAIWGRPRNVMTNPHFHALRNWLDLTGDPSPPYSSLDEGIAACLAKRPPLDQTIPPPP